MPYTSANGTSVAKPSCKEAAAPQQFVRGNHHRPENAEEEQEVGRRQMDDLARPQLAGKQVVKKTYHQGTGGLRGGGRVVAFVPGALQRGQERERQRRGQQRPALRRPRPRR